MDLDTDSSNEDFIPPDSPNFSFSSESSEELLGRQSPGLNISATDDSDMDVDDNTANVDTPDTSDTEPYDVGDINPVIVLDRLPINPIPDDEIIVIGTQQEAEAAIPNVLAAPVRPVLIEDDDDDCVLIPQTVETIDLCNSAPRIRPMRTDEVIEIQDSPASGRNRVESTVQLPSIASSVRRMLTESVGRMGHFLGSDRATVPAAATSQASRTGPASKKTRLNLDDSDRANETGTLASCPICLESTLKRDPVSTNCGHVFCQRCIAAALVISKKCPMCKKALTAKNPYHKLYF